MTQLDDLVVCLLDSATAPHPEGQGTYLHYFDAANSSLVSKLWKDGNKSSPETVAKSVRPNTSASYVLEPPTQLVAYVSSTNELRIQRYDDEGEEWFDDKTGPRHEVHPGAMSLLRPLARRRIAFV
jgi:hypothetical protein